MSKCFGKFMNTGWKITACLSFLAVVLSVACLVLADYNAGLAMKVAPSQPLGILAYVGLIGGIAVMMNAIGARILHSFMLVLPTLFIIYDLTLGNDKFFIAGVVISAIVALALNVMAKVRK